MPQTDRACLWTALCPISNQSGRFLSDAGKTVALRDLMHGSSLSGRVQELRGRSVLIAAGDQLTAALAVIELDGVARRIILCAPDLAADHLRSIADAASADAIITEPTGNREKLLGIECYSCTCSLIRADRDRTASHRTEWILLTSGTTGHPKMVVHTLATLAGGISDRGPLADGHVWGTFYDIRRYGGLQVFLRAMLTGGSLVLSSPSESVADFLNRAGAAGATHVSGTPSHWRRALMSPAGQSIRPKYVRLSGEIADQIILDRLRSLYPLATIAHAFASTEAGLAFDVRDGFAGFPANLMQQGRGDVKMKVEDGSLRICSSRTAVRYIGKQNTALADEAGFVDTGDVLELRGDRYYFLGRRDGVINVGGLKVHPEEVESVINRHPQVRMSLVRTKKNPITGSLVIADVVLRPSSDVGKSQARKLEEEILHLCRQSLPRHKVPVAISFTAELPVASTGKLMRRGA